MRFAWLAFGFLNLGLGAAGIVLPLVPATPFLLLAAWAFARSSDRFHLWLVEHRTFGPAIRAWHMRRAIGRRAKFATLASLAASLGIALAAGAPETILAMQGFAAAGVCAFILTRPDA